MGNYGAGATSQFLWLDWRSIIGTYTWTSLITTLHGLELQLGFFKLPRGVAASERTWALMKAAMKNIKNQSLMVDPRNFTRIPTGHHMREKQLNRAYGEVLKSNILARSLLEIGLLRRVLFLLGCEPIPSVTHISLTHWIAISCCICKSMEHV